MEYKFLDINGLQHVIEKIDMKKANLTSPDFLGTPTAPTPIDTDNSKQIATTEFVKQAIALASIPGINTLEALDNHTNELINARLEDIQNGSY